MAWAVGELSPLLALGAAEEVRWIQALAVEGAGRPCWALEVVAEDHLMMATGEPAEAEYLLKGEKGLDEHSTEEVEVGHCLDSVAEEEVVGYKTSFLLVSLGVTEVEDRCLASAEAVGRDLYLGAREELTTCDPLGMVEVGGSQGFHCLLQPSVAGAEEGAQGS